MRLPDLKIQHPTKYYKKKTSPTVTKTYKNIKFHQEQKFIIGEGTKAPICIKLHGFYVLVF